jgi:hypothetical protein
MADTPDKNDQAVFTLRTPSDSLVDTINNKESIDELIRAIPSPPQQLPSPPQLTQRTKEAVHSLFSLKGNCHEPANNTATSPDNDNSASSDDAAPFLNGATVPANSVLVPREQNHQSSHLKCTMTLYTCALTHWDATPYCAG